MGIFYEQITKHITKYCFNAYVWWTLNVSRCLTCVCLQFYILYCVVFILLQCFIFIFYFFQFTSLFFRRRSFNRTLCWGAMRVETKKFFFFLFHFILKQNVEAEKKKYVTLCRYICLCIYSEDYVFQKIKFIFYFHFASSMENKHIGILITTNYHLKFELM